MADDKSEKRLAMIEAILAKGSKDPFHHYARAMELRSAGRLEEALSAFGEVESRFPDYVPTYLMTAQTAQQIGHLDAARAACERGITAARKAGDGKTLGEIEAFLSGLSI